MISILIPNLPAEIVLGWVQDLYSVNEDVGQARLCAGILFGSLAVALPQLNVATRDGTASRGGGGVQQDYIPTPTPNQFRFSSNNMGDMCTNIPIVDDLVLEMTVEDFFADLSFNAGEEPERVTISPATTEIDITDNDGKPFFFKIIVHNKKVKRIKNYVCPCRNHYWFPSDDVQGQ